jgi:hypothetical protein
MLAVQSKLLFIRSKDVYDPLNSLPDAITSVEVLYEL